MKIRLTFWLPAVLGLAADLVTKHLVFAALPGRGDQRAVLGDWLVICHQENRGGVFGIAQGKSYVFVALSFIALAVVIWMLRQAEPRQRLMPVALGLVVAGALGNLVDRLWLGYVRDFIYVKVINYPAFNVADACICVAAGMLILAVLRDGGGRKKDT